MSDISNKKAEEALREYLEAVENHDRVVDKYFPVRPVIPGKPIAAGEPLTEASIKELEEAEAKVAGTLKKWHRLLGL
ncbi:hypothetical protein ES708_26994 [subsurface metagenome]